MQKTFSIAALLTLTGVVAAILSGVFAGQKRKQAGPDVAVRPLLRSEIVHPRADPLLQDHAERVISQFMTDAIASALGDTVRDVSVESWHVNRSGRSLVVHARWTDAATGEVSSQKLRFAKVSDGIYVREITGSTGSHAEEVITIGFGASD